MAASVKRTTVSLSGLALGMTPELNHVRVIVTWQIRGWLRFSPFSGHGLCGVCRGEVAA
jgi:hypothetical protein